jgi:hypothetical protein
MKPPTLPLLRIDWPTAAVASDGCDIMTLLMCVRADLECAKNFTVAGYVTSELGGLDHVGFVFVLLTFGKLHVALHLLMATSSSATEKRTT